MTGWLVGQDRRDDAALVMTYVATLDGARLPRAATPLGLRIDVPGLDLRTVAPAALTVREGE